MNLVVVYSSDDNYARHTGVSIVSLLDNNKHFDDIHIYVIDNKIMRGYEIIKHLQGLIFLRNEQYNKDFSTAIEDWENDIIFIEEYIISKSK